MCEKAATNRLGPSHPHPMARLVGGWPLASALTLLGDKRRVRLTGHVEPFCLSISISVVSMLTSSHRLRGSLIALAAFFGASSLGVVEIQACSTMKTAGGCASACGCCDPSPSVSDDAPAAGIPASSRLATSPLAETRAASPMSTCECRTGQPEAVEPEPAQRIANEQSGSPHHGASPTLIVLDPPSKTLRLLLSPYAGLWNAPIYLRTSRLLI